MSRLQLQYVWWNWPVSRRRGPFFYGELAEPRQPFKHRGNLLCTADRKFYATNTLFDRAESAAHRAAAAASCPPEKLKSIFALKSMCRSVSIRKLNETVQNLFQV